MESEGGESEYVGGNNVFAVYAPVAGINDPHSWVISLGIAQTPFTAEAHPDWFAAAGIDASLLAQEDKPPYIEPMDGFGPEAVRLHLRYILRDGVPLTLKDCIHVQPDWTAFHGHLWAYGNERSAQGYPAFTYNDAMTLAPAVVDETRGWVKLYDHLSHVPHHSGPFQHSTIAEWMEEHDGAFWASLLADPSAAHAQQAVTAWINFKGPGSTHWNDNVPHLSDDDRDYAYSVCKLYDGAGADEHEGGDDA